MSGITTYLENALENAVLRNTSYTSPATVYLALFTVAPGVGGGGTEVSGGSYARQAVTFSAPASGATSNSGAITFPTATANWGTVVAWGLFDAATSGNLLLFGTLVGTNEVQSLVQGGSGLSGTYTLTFGGQTTAAIPQAATAAEVEEFLEELPSIGDGNVTVTGTTMTGTGGTYTITFVGSLANAAQAVITDTSSLTGTSPTLTISETTQGATGSKIINNGDAISFAATKVSVTIS